MFRKMVGLAFLMVGAGDAGLRSPPERQACLMQQPRSHRGPESEAHGQRAKAVHPSNVPSEAHFSRGQSGEGFGRAQRQRAFRGFGGARRDASKGGAGLDS